MTIKIDKQIIKNAYEWVKYSGKQDQQIEQLYQASTGMIGGITTTFSSTSQNKGRESSYIERGGLFGGSDSSTGYTNTSTTSSSKSVQLCDYLEGDEQLSSRAAKYSKYWVALSGLHYDLLVVVQAIKQRVALDVSWWVVDRGHFGSDFDGLIHRFNQDLRVNWYADRPLPGYPILIKYLQMIEDYLWCDFSKVVEGKGECYYPILNKHTLVTTHLRVFEGEIYSFQCTPRLMSCVGNPIFTKWIDSCSLQECRDRLELQLLNLLPCQVERTHKEGLFSNIDEVWLEFVREHRDEQK